MVIKPNSFVKVKPEHCTPGLSPDTQLKVIAVYGNTVKVEYPAPKIPEDKRNEYGHGSAKQQGLERLINIKGVIQC